MSFAVADALPILRRHLGETVNKVKQGARKGLENKKVNGFHTGSGRALALDVYPGNLGRVRLWLEPASIPYISGIRSFPYKTCDDLKRQELKNLRDNKSNYIEVENKEALEQLLKWYV
ncbi:hypothetical protein [Cohaesibacter haloalkalitolerans]|uniref:hypothetical protein n=1 Tax=Cohaesibacter haloalkalitolerans TaxID=1162980 RepID=UPI000E64AA99|nr:hypothetical protein [Cohaesibacter haloalkalitolerans]